MNYVEGRFVYGDDVYIDDHYLDERWAYVFGFPGYMVSDKGRVWSEKTLKFLKPFFSNGHLYVCLCVNGRVKKELLHRLVAEAFIPNPNNFPIVRHLYDYPDQNSADDLAWGTQRDNIQDAIRNEKMYLVSKDQRIPVVATEISTNKKTCFESCREASRQLNIPRTNIWRVLTGKQKQANGHFFEEVRDD